MPPVSYVIEVVVPEQHNLPGMYMGRTVRHDSRNKLYPWQAQIRQIKSQLWPRHSSILNQGQVGSCTGNMMTGDLATDPVYAALNLQTMPVLNEALALVLYGAAEKLDGGAGYPPEDEGSSGPSVAQAALNAKYISGYQHCFSLVDMLDALEDYPVGMGSNWYESMFNPDSSGVVTISPGSEVAGGHEYLCRGKDVVAQTLRFDNSWGSGWGDQGSFTMSYATVERLLSEQGDVTVMLPLTTPAPTPLPAVPAKF